MILATGLLFFLNTSMSKEDFAVVGLADAVPALHRPDRGGLPDPACRRRKPGLPGNDRAQGESKAPLGELVRSHKKSGAVLHHDLHRQQRCGVPADRLLHLLRNQVAADAHAQVLLATTLASFGWLIFTLVGGWLSDRIGRVKTFLTGYAIVFAWMIPMFALIDTKEHLCSTGWRCSSSPWAWACPTAPCPQCTRRCSRPTSGTPASPSATPSAPSWAGPSPPPSPKSLLQATKWTGSIGIYIMILCVISAIGVVLAKETKGRPLGVSHH
jgi:hypothetical protein